MEGGEMLSQDLNTPSAKSAMLPPSYTSIEMEEGEDPGDINVKIGLQTFKPESNDILPNHVKKKIGEDGNDDDDDDDDDEKSSESHFENKFILLISSGRRNLDSFYTEHKVAIRTAAKFIFFVGVCVYLGLAFKYSFGDDQSLTLLGVTCAFLGYYSLSRLFTLCRASENLRISERVNFVNSKRWKYCYSIFTAALMTSLVLYVVSESAMRRPSNLISGLGILVFVFLLLVFSKHPDKVRWRPVVWGILLQFVFGLLVLRTRWGLASFQWLADRMKEYLDHTDAGARFVFGDSYMDHFVIFGVMPPIIVFSATISILYYIGAMQVAINAITYLMRVSLRTGPVETLHAAFNIFVGWAETVPVVQPLLDTMSLSELHAVMTNGFATVSGGTLAGYIFYGAPANHLISASFMSAPAALAVGKLFYPEIKPGRRKQNAPVIPKSDKGIIEAASAGAVSAIPVVAYIVVHLIAFLSLLDFINDTLAWLGARVGITPPHHPQLSFQYISSYLMWPVAFLMGVQMSDCRTVARMLGLKVFVNEFFAFADLGNVRKNNVILQNYTAFFDNATWHWTATDDIQLDITGEILKGGAISERSATIATYAVCGFSDLAAMGMMIGAFSAVAPSRKREIIKVAPRALISGVMACFLTAAMAGLMTLD